MRYLTVLTALFLCACTSSSSQISIGDKVSPQTPVIGCPEPELTSELLDAAAQKDAKKFTGMLLSGGGVCLQMPSGTSFVVIAKAVMSNKDRTYKLIGVRLASVPNGGAFWVPEQMLIAASPMPPD